MRTWIAAVFFAVSGPAMAQMPDISRIVDAHILPGYARLSDATQALSQTAATTCDPEDADLRAAYSDAFDAWILVSHLRFGPSETEDRAFALAFWPDPRGVTPKTLGTLIRDRDAVIDTAESFKTVSVAVRGFYALEFLLYDPQLMQDASSDYGCALIRAITRDMSQTSAAISAEWMETHADLMRSPGANTTYRSETEAAQQLFTALSTGLQFTSETRLGRPVGTFDRPRPKRAEARRSERSLRHVQLSLAATRALAHMLSDGDVHIAEAFDRAERIAAELDDPVFAGVADPQGRFRVEVLQQAINDLRGRIATDLGPRLGISAGFNALDGD